MQHSSEMRRCLEEVDVPGIKTLWRHISPHLPQPKNDPDVIVAIHYARTASSSMAFRLRAYSHWWLNERSLPSGLPDRLKKSADQLTPKISDAVGISVNASSELLKPILPYVRKAMEDVVEDCWASGDKDTLIVRQRLFEARRNTIKKLLAFNLEK